MKSIKKRTIKPSDLLTNRDKLSREITSLWNIIRTENIISKSDKRNYDIESTYSRIKRLTDERIKTKLRQQCVNLGISFKDLNPNANVINIYKLCEITEQKVQLLDILKNHTIAPALKAKVGKKGLDRTEILTSAFVKKELKKADLLINELKKKIDDFNNEVEIEEEESSVYLAA